MTENETHIRWFETLKSDDVDSVGGKNAALGKMIQELAYLFDERNLAVKRTVRTVIERAHEGGVKVGICDQAPSDYPEFAAFLVEAGIDSISLNPDSALDIKRRVADAEQG